VGSAADVQFGFIWIHDMKRQTGFTLIELVMVIVILGVLAAVAIPKFVDLKGDAQLASLNGVAGAASSASAINYAACAVTSGASAANRCFTVNTCDSVKQSLSGGVWPSNYSTSGAGSVVNGTQSTCTLALAGYTPTVSFLVISAGN
jgi:MSHA pilin protein MshA